MSNVILISNNEIGFQVSIGNNEGRLRRIVTAESFYTDYGFVIPVTTFDMLILDYLDTRHDIKLPLDSPEKGHVYSAIVITKEGKMYNLGYVAEQAKFVTLPLLYGKGEIYAIADVASLELAGLMALRLTQGSVSAASKLMGKCFWTRPDSTAILKISDIVEELNRRKPPKSIFQTVPLPD